MKKTCTLILTLGVAALFLGCDKKNPVPGNGVAQKKLRLAFVCNGPKNEFWSIVQLGCDFGVRQAGDVEVDFRAPTNPNPTAAAQQEIMSDLIAAGVDGIAISPIDAETQTEFLNQTAAKTLLVCADSDAEKSRRTCYIGTDNAAAGKQAAELLKAALPQGGKAVLFVGHSSAENSK
ncbi:MAG: substrate-binding domain-containing protein, partial [Verrucomicrobia bacterium]|nr:substrate-binding domain-containing protein [Verrucomicrobiota bacterium]